MHYTVFVLAFYSHSYILKIEVILTQLDKLKLNKSFHTLKTILIILMRVCIQEPIRATKTTFYAQKRT
jgi:hypothetical protein